MAQAGADDNGSPFKLTSAEEKELAELRRRALQFELGNEIFTRGGLFRPGERSREVTFRRPASLQPREFPLRWLLGAERIHIGYYEWPRRPVSPRRTRDQEPMKLIREIHKESRGTYGWPRLLAELARRPTAQSNRWQTSLCASARRVTVTGRTKQRPVLADE